MGDGAPTRASTVRAGTPGRRLSEEITVPASDQQSHGTRCSNLGEELARPALARPSQRAPHSLALALLSGVAVVATFSVTEPVTLIQLICPLWMIRGRAFPTASTACERACRSAGRNRTQTGLVVGAHVVPLVEGKRRELDRRDVCPGGPTGQGPARGQIVPVSRSRAGADGNRRPWTTPVDNTCGQRHRLSTPSV